MTTIAYHHGDKQIAVDSRTTAGGSVLTDTANKVFKADGVVWFLAGLTCDMDAFIEHYASGECSGALDCSAFIIKGGLAYAVAVKDGKYKTSPLTYSDALGSGWKWACAAMDHGKSAAGAVKYAATRCVYTGGRVRTFRV